MSHFKDVLTNLETAGNLRHIPADDRGDCIDFSTNDYLGLAQRADLQQAFFEDPENRRIPMSSSAARLLAPRQLEHLALEQLMADLYSRDVLLFNSGYHANTGIISAIAASDTYIIADKLSHASIIDGIVLSRAPFNRFPHNDYERLEKLVAANYDKYEQLLVVTESVFSMDGDSADIDALIRIKKRYPKVMLYVDEAHAFGVLGSQGLGLCHESPDYELVDIVVGTFGKAAASFGAFAAVSPTVKAYLVNKARSFIFSTAISPMNSAWTRFMVSNIIKMESERRHLADLAIKLSKVLNNPAPSHIAPLIVGDAHRAVALSTQLLKLGYKALPIRTPTVPAGTERLRFSLSAAMTSENIDGLAKALASLT
jgi:8-amino-7-oxononanoate synthase